MILISKIITNPTEINNIVSEYYKENNIDLSIPFSIGSTIEADQKGCYVVSVVYGKPGGITYLLSKTPLIERQSIGKNITLCSK